MSPITGLDAGEGAPKKHAADGDGVSAVIMQCMSGAAAPAPGEITSSGRTYLGASNATLGGHQQNGDTYGPQTLSQSTATTTTVFNLITVDTVNFHVNNAPGPTEHPLFGAIKRLAIGISAFLAQIPWALATLRGSHVGSTIEYYLVQPIWLLLKYLFCAASHGGPPTKHRVGSATQPRPPAPSSPSSARTNSFRGFDFSRFRRRSTC
ncbi:hypothetical protein JDV02_010248 [Purpureocillium takamizusanense]|uniref:Uncharacterized protein n=1 Tax=Purpureocillium takamizusanense TaxID=2060973 RepID=A0A9Q8QTP6_9HYPO|nr:uncharacterized protein JDV02_010248 [Purpureocillium takamizusanense]UNI24509.1 hypothetical protein JDV02_010248 [Purpureocillium takamizusanense]